MTHHSSFRIHHSSRMSLAWLLFATFATMTVLVVSIIGSFLFYRDYRRFQLEADHLRRDHIERQQQRVKNEVDRVIQYIQHSRAKTQERLKASIKDRTYEAHAIATHLYREHYGKMDDQGVRRLIIEALRPIRFNNGRGYYFATGFDGVEILFADRPEMEGKLLLDLQDTRGAFVIRDMIDLVERHGEGFYEYVWTRPNVQGQDFPKIAFVKYFAPFNGFIGTGEYLEDVEQDIQQEVLATIGNIRFDQDGYLFVVGYDGVTLMNDVQPQLIGKDLWDMTDPNGVKVIQEERLVAEKPGGDFIHYHWENPSTRQVRPKVSFVRGFPEWRWMVGAGFYSDEVESVIAARQGELWRKMRMDSLTVCLILIGILLSTVFFSYCLARTFKRQVEHFLTFFRDMETGGTAIAVEQLRLRELETLAGSANSMLAKHLQADKELRDSEERYRQLFESESDAILLIDNETGRILEANNAASAMYGYSREELQTLKNADLSVEPEGTHRVARETPVVSDCVVTVPLRFHRKKDGTVFPVEITGRFFIWQERPVHIAAIRDITERKKAEEERLELERQLQQARKAESLGRMAGAIAHHFNNLLGAVLGNLELALFDLPQGPGPRESIAEAMTASRRAAEISRLMLAYLGQGAGERKALDLSGLCRETLPVLIASLPKNVRLKSELPDPGPIILGDAMQVKQVLANLVANAEEALGAEEGDITVAVSLVRADDVRIPRTHIVEWEPTEEAYACLAVSDSGCGMDSETRERIFDPFFSTRFTGRGLGLPVVLGTVKAHQGAVVVESEPGRGSVFRVYLPLSTEQPCPSPIAEAVAHEPPRERGLVLLVEDEPAMRKMAQTMLKRLGWEVMTACDGIEALEVFQRHQDRIQCLLLDLSMPRMGGWETLAAVRAIRPDIAVVLASGYDEAQVMAGDHPEWPQAFLSKPYQMAQLKVALARAAVRAVQVPETGDEENSDGQGHPC